MYALYHASGLWAVFALAFQSSTATPVVSGRFLRGTQKMLTNSRSPSPKANVTEPNFTDISSVELERAGCRWFCTGENGCRWICAGGRRLNGNDDASNAARNQSASDAARNQSGADVTELNFVEISSVELERAGCRWFCTGENGCRWICAGGRRLNGIDDASDASRTEPGANVTEFSFEKPPSVELERAGCRWFCTGNNGCRWICAGGRRLNGTDDASDASRTEPGANVTEFSFEKPPSVELERAGCRWFCTGENGCRWICAGGRRLNGIDDASDASRTEPGANVTEFNFEEPPSVELERAGCRWFCTGENGCRWICAGGRRLDTAGNEKPMDNLTMTDEFANASIQAPTFV